MSKRSTARATQSTKQLPYGARTVHHCRTQAVDFLRNKGGPIGVTLVIDASNARRLRGAITTCLNAIKKLSRGNVQIDARWGKNMREKGGYLLDVRVRP
jgi:hypothetical protein